MENVFPNFLAFEDRGSILFDPTTTSSVQKPNSYCKDIRGCGAKDYRTVSAGVTLQYLDGCVPRLNGVLSLSVLVKNIATNSDIDAMLNYVRQLGGFDAAAFSGCGTFLDVN